MQLAPYSIAVGLWNVNQRLTKKQTLLVSEKAVKVISPFLHFKLCSLLSLSSHKCVVISHSYIPIYATYKIM